MDANFGATVVCKYTEVPSFPAHSLFIHCQSFLIIKTLSHLFAGLLGFVAGHFVGQSHQAQNFDNDSIG